MKTWKHNDLAGYIGFTNGWKNGKQIVTLLLCGKEMASRSVVFKGALQNDIYTTAYGIAVDLGLN